MEIYNLTRSVSGAGKKHRDKQKVHLMEAKIRTE